jgi:hypothetical protein
MYPFALDPTICDTSPQVHEMFANPTEPDEQVLAHLGEAALAPLAPLAPAPVVAAEEHGEDDAAEDQGAEEGQEDEENEEEGAAVDGALLGEKKGSLEVSCMEVRNSHIVCTLPHTHKHTHTHRARSLRKTKSARLWLTRTSFTGQRYVCSPRQCLLVLLSLTDPLRRLRST